MTALLKALIVRQNKYRPIRRFVVCGKILLYTNTASLE
jgi:hypothetical protein